MNWLEEIKAAAYPESISHIRFGMNPYNPETPITLYAMYTFAQVEEELRKVSISEKEAYKHILPCIAWTPSYVIITEIYEPTVYFRRFLRNPTTEPSWPNYFFIDSPSEY